MAQNLCVAPLVGAWIEICGSVTKYSRNSVAPLVGAWIEIIMPSVSLPELHVAPLVGAWIEIKVKSLSLYLDTVAPLVGAWIEIFSRQRVTCLLECRSRGGLVVVNFCSCRRKVCCCGGGLVGAWIEIMYEFFHILSCNGRSPRGSVD